MHLERSPFFAWTLGVASSALPVAIAFACWPDLASAPYALASLALATALVVVLGLVARSEPSEARCAWSAGAGIGVLAGVLVAQPTPTCWLMSDVAWHSAKIALVARGHLLEDPILRVPTVYPFGFHALLAPFVAAGVPLRAVLFATSPIVLVLETWSFYRLLRVFADARSAAWGALALPFAFYAAFEGFAFLPNPFNASLVLAFVGLGAVARAERSTGRALAVVGGLALGVAALIWYGHWPWIGASLAVLAWKRRALATNVALGMLPCALVLAIHLTILASASSTDASAIASAAAPEDLATRLEGMGRNLLTLSGGARFDDAPWWIGPVVLGLCAHAWLRPRSAPRGFPEVLAIACVVVPICLALAGLRMTFWRPFSWRYGFLLFALLVAFACTARELRIGRTLVPAVAVAALLAPWSVGRGLLACLQRSRAYVELHEHGGAAVARYIAEHVPLEEPVFASADTWDRAIGPLEPRPNLVARNGGLYNFAPAGVVAPRWSAYQDVLATDDPERARELLAPYGFHLAVVGTDEARKQPGLAALLRGFEPVLETDAFVIVDLERAKR